MESLSPLKILKKSHSFDLEASEILLHVFQAFKGPSIKDVRKRGGGGLGRCGPPHFLNKFCQLKSKAKYKFQQIIDKTVNKLFII